MKRGEVGDVEHATTDGLAYDGMAHQRTRTHRPLLFTSCRGSSRPLPGNRHPPSLGGDWRNRPTASRRPPSAVGDTAYLPRHTASRPVRRSAQYGRAVALRRQLEHRDRCSDASTVLATPPPELGGGTANGTGRAQQDTDGGKATQKQQEWRRRCIQGRHTRNKESDIRITSFNKISTGTHLFMVLYQVYNFLRKTFKHFTWCILIFFS